MSQPSFPDPYNPRSTPVQPLPSFQPPALFDERQAYAWRAYGPPQALKRARVLMFIVGFWSLFVATIVLVIAFSSGEGGSFSVAESTLLGLAVALGMGTGLLYVLLAGKVYHGTSWAVTTMRVIVIISLVSRVIGFAAEPTGLLQELIGGGLEVWLLACLYNAEAKEYVAWRKHAAMNQ